MLQRIAELAEDVSPNGRRELLLALTDLFSVHADSDSSGEALKPLRKLSQERRMSSTLLIADLQEQRRTSDEVITILAREDRPYELAQVMSFLTSIPKATALKRLLDPDASDLAETCRSIGLASAACRALLELRAVRLNLSPTRVQRESNAYEQLSQ